MPASPPIVSDIAGYDLIKDKIIYVWDVQRRWRATKAEKERKKQLAIEAALACSASSSLKICTYWFQGLFNSLDLQRQQQYLRFPIAVENLAEL